MFVTQVSLGWEDQKNNILKKYKAMQNLNISNIFADFNQNEQ